MEFVSPSSTGTSSPQLQVFHLLLRGPRSPIPHFIAAQRSEGLMHRPPTATHSEGGNLRGLAPRSLPRDAGVSPQSYQSLAGVSSGCLCSRRWERGREGNHARLTLALTTSLCATCPTVPLSFSHPPSSSCPFPPLSVFLIPFYHCGFAVAIVRISSCAHFHYQLILLTWFTQVLVIDSLPLADPRSIAGCLEWEKPGRGHRYPHYIDIHPLSRTTNKFASEVTNTDDDKVDSQKLEATLPKTDHTHTQIPKLWMRATLAKLSHDPAKQVDDKGAERAKDGVW